MHVHFCFHGYQKGNTRNSRTSTGFNIAFCPELPRDFFPASFILFNFQQPDAAQMCGNITFAEAEPIQECVAHKFIINENTIYAIPMLLFSFMCHGNILSIVAELKSPTRRRMRQLIFGAAIPCTILYTLTALFGYFSYFNRTESMLLGYVDSCFFLDLISRKLIRLGQS